MTDDTADAIRYFLRSIGRLPDPNRYVAFEEVGYPKRYTYVDEIGDPELLSRNRLLCNAVARGEAVDMPTATKSIESMAADARKAVDRRTVEILRRDAGHTFESDGFSMRVCDDAMWAVEDAGFGDSVWWADAATVDAARRWYDERMTIDTGVGLEPFPMIANRSVIEAPNDVGLDGDLFLVGVDAIAEPPISIPSKPIIVREPTGVARVITGTGDE